MFSLAPAFPLFTGGLGSGGESVVFAACVVVFEDGGTSNLLACAKCTVAFAISYNHEYSQFIHECIVAFVNTAPSRMRQLIHEGQVGDTQLLYMMLTTCGRLF